MEEKDHRSTGTLANLAETVKEAVIGSEAPSESQEADVAGPLTLEEAKAVGDVPEDFQVKEEKSEGFLKRATHMFIGDSAPQASDDQLPVTDSPVEQAGEDAAISAPTVLDTDDNTAADVISDEEPHDDHEKKVSFAEDANDAADEPKATEKDGKAARKKSFLGFLSKKKKSGEREEAPGARENTPEVAGEAITGEEMAKEEPPIGDTQEAPTGTPEEAPISATEGATTLTEEKPKKKNLLSGLFHRKDKHAEGGPTLPLEEEKQSEGIGEADAGVAGTAAAAVADAKDDLAATKEDEGLASAAAEVPEKAKEVAQDATDDAQVGNTVTDDNSAPKKDKKKSFLGGLFSKKKHEEPSATTPEPIVEEAEAGAVPALENVEGGTAPAAVESIQSGENAGEEQGPLGDLNEDKPQETKLDANPAEVAYAGGGDDFTSGAAGAAAVGAGLGATGAAMVVSNGGEEKGDDNAQAAGISQQETVAGVTDHQAAATTTAAPTSQQEQPAKKRSWWWSKKKEQPKPSPGSEVLKSGEVQKKGVIFGWNQLRYMRIMSDGTLQWNRVNNFDDAKGLKLQHDMRIKSLDVSTAFPYVLKIYVGEERPIFLVFKDKAERDSWLNTLNDVKERLGATRQTQGPDQVIKSGNIEGGVEGAETPTN